MKTSKKIYFYFLEVLHLQHFHYKS